MTDRAMAFLRPALLIPAAVIALFAVLFLTNQQRQMAQVAPAVKPVIQPEAMKEQRASKDAYLKTEANAKAAEKTADEKLHESDRDTSTPGGYLQGSQKAANEPVTENKNLTDRLDTGRVQEEAKLKQAPASEAGGGLAVSAQQPAEQQPAPPPQEIAQKPAAASPQPMENALAKKSEPAPAAAPTTVKSQMASESAAQRKGDLSDSPAWNFDQAQQNFRQDQMSKGVQYMQQAINTDHNKDLATQFYNAGVLYQAKKEYSKAIIQYRVLVNNYQAYQALNDVLFRLGECYFAIGKTDNAKSIFQQLLKSNPDSKTLKDRIAEIDRQEKAREELRSLGYIDPQ